MDRKGEARMKEVRGDIWNFHEQGHWIVIMTNSSIKKDGQAVMGKGIAYQAARKFPELPLLLADELKANGNQIFFFYNLRLITFPTKNDWREPSSLITIEVSARHLAQTVDVAATRWGFNLDEVYMVRPGCGNGGLNWKDVKPILEKYLDDRFIVVERG